MAAPVEVGKSVQARVLDVVKADRILDLSLRPELVQAGNQESTKKKNKKVLFLEGSSCLLVSDSFICDYRIAELVCYVFFILLMFSNLRISHDILNQPREL